jgi:predicted ATP-grasp superfamily ATP-dependent carboligase
MQVLIYEALSAGAISAPSPCDSLLVEGRAMLSALIEDFSQIIGLTISTLVQSGSNPLLATGPPTESRCVEQIQETHDQEPAVFRHLAAKADFSLVIAPEFEGILLERCQWVEQSGGRLLGPSSEAVRLTADKLKLAAHLSERKIPTPPCFVAQPGTSCLFPAVLKPRDGAGSQATILIKREQEIDQAIQWARDEGWAGELLLQPYIVGQPCSVSFLIGPNQIEPLLPASQELSTDGRFHYMGGVLPLPPGLAQRAIRLGGHAVRTIPGLRGYVGVDLILGDREDGTNDQVIEINPRVTTSYVGLRALAKTNLATAMIQIADGKRIEVVEWKKGMVRFWPDGRVITV